MYRRVLNLLFLILFGLSFSSTALAVSTVKFEGGAENFVFYSDNSKTETDLFGGLKDLMPGDTKTETITIKNTARDYDYVKIFLRAEPPTETNALLNHLTLNIYHDNVLVSSSPASNQDTLASNLELGTFNYGEETLLAVEIIAPSDLGNNYEYTEGEINWIFTAEAYKDGKIVSPNTGVTSSLDSSNVFPEILIASLLAITILSIIISLHKISLN
ncbi:hypothetical protein IJI70_00775 [Candidatus Saccharibacteria bacterium]|nr:hypothetical protein [Candidatus Saccharibacteria bacterium]